MRKTKREAFREACESAANRADCGVAFYDDKSNQAPFYDDGALHVTYRGMRAAFDVDQDAPGREQNFRIRAILDRLGIAVLDKGRISVDESFDVEQDDA